MWIKEGGATAVNIRGKISDEKYNVQNYVYIHTYIQSKHNKLVR
jgi:hypothetical protein